MITLPPDFTEDQKATALTRISIMQEGNNFPIDDNPPSQILQTAIQEAIELERCFVCEKRKCECNT